MAAIHSFLCFESVGKRNSFIPVDFLNLEVHPNAQQLDSIIEINAYLPYKMARHVTFTFFTPTHEKGLYMMESNVYGLGTTRSGK